MSDGRNINTLDTNYFHFDQIREKKYDTYLKSYFRLNNGMIQPSEFHLRYLIRQANIRLLRT